MAAAATKQWTYEMLESLPDDGNRYEIIDGELFVTPPPAFGHQRAQWELGRLIANYLDRYAVGQGFFAPGDARAETLSEDIEWQPVVEYPPLRIDLAEFFARAHGESPQS